MHRVLRSASASSAAQRSFPWLRGRRPPSNVHPPAPTTGGAQERPRWPRFQATPRPAAPITSVAPCSRGSTAGGAGPQFPHPFPSHHNSPSRSRGLLRGYGRGPDSERRLQNKVFWRLPLSFHGLRAAGTPPPAQREPPHPPLRKPPPPAHPCVPASPSRMFLGHWRRVPPSSSN